MNNVSIIILVLCRATFLRFGKACAPEEYPSAGGECCPMCNIGSVVRSDCTQDYSTICKACTSGTFMNQPNSQKRCFTCRNCEESQGLYIKSQCTMISDTICDALDGYYCPTDSKCSQAKKHSVCKPGQGTKTPGTTTSDTVCVNCTEGFYSVSGHDCIKWTDCTRNEIQTESGSDKKDVTCIPKKRERYGLIVSVGLILLFWVPLCLLQKNTLHNLGRPVKETHFFKYRTAYIIPEEDEEQ